MLYPISTNDGGFKLLYCKVGIEVGIGGGCSRKRGDFSRRPACEVSVRIWEASVMQKLRSNCICSYWTHRVCRASACQLVYGLFEYVKSTDSTTSVHRVLHTSFNFWSSAVVVVSMAYLYSRHTGGAVPLRFLVKTVITVVTPPVVFHSFPLLVTHFSSSRCGGTTAFSLRTWRSLGVTTAV